MSCYTILCYAVFITVSCVVLGYAVSCVVLGCCSVYLCVCFLGDMHACLSQCQWQSTRTVSQRMLGKPISRAGLGPAVSASHVALQQSNYPGFTAFRWGHCGYRAKSPPSDPPSPCTQTGERTWTSCPSDGPWEHCNRQTNKKNPTQHNTAQLNGF